MGARPISQAMLAKRSSFGDFTPGNGRRQCVAIAKATGERCRQDAVGHAKRCKAHKGIQEARQALRRKGERVVRSTLDYVARDMLFKASFETPEGFACEAIGVPRGRLVEAYKNKRGALGVSQQSERELAIKTLREICEDFSAPKQSKATAARTLLELSGDIGKLQTSRPNETKNLHEMTRQELDVEIARMAPPSKPSKSASSASSDASSEARAKRASRAPSKRGRRLKPSKPKRASKRSNYSSKRASSALGEAKTYDF